MIKQELVREWMTRDVLTVAPGTPLPEAHRLMTSRKIRRLPVVDEGRVVGMVTRGDVRGAEASDARTLSIWELSYLLARLRVAEIMTREPVTIAETATVGEAAGLMLEHRVSGLPVVDEAGHIAGIITESDIFRMVAHTWLEGDSPLQQEIVESWMTGDVVTIAPDTSIYEAHRIMRLLNIRRLPVLDENELVGMVTRGDIRGAQPSEATSLSIWEVNYLLSKTTVAEIMFPNPKRILPSNTVGEAAQLMLAEKISGLPVVDMAGNVVGIITESDIFRLIVHKWKEEAGDL